MTAPPQADFGAFEPVSSFGWSRAELRDEEFETLRRLIYDHFGIALAEEKRSLVVGRLQKILRQKRMNSYRQYIEYLAADGSGRALAELVDRISTNHTYFNREKAHFDFYLQALLPEWTKKLEARGSRDLRIWCAACSSGEEPYMLQMLLFEYFGTRYGSWDAGVLATDISHQILAEAMAGIYDADRVKLMPAPFLQKYFDRLPDGRFRVKDAVRKEVVYRKFNLMNKSLPFKKPFQCIFCRNVMIYFDQQTRDELVKRFHRFIEPGGYLFIGHSETLGRDNKLYEYIQPAVYRKPE